MVKAAVLTKTLKHFGLNYQNVLVLVLFHATIRTWKRVLFAAHCVVFIQPSAGMYQGSH